MIHSLKKLTFEVKFIMLPFQTLFLFRTSDVPRRTYSMEHFNLTHQLDQLWYNSFKSVRIKLKKNV
jgi:hypothetical protein